MNSIRKRKQLIFYKWAVYTLALLLGAVLQTVPFLFQIGSVKPIYILPLCVAVAMHEGEFSSAIFAVVAGLLWDYSAGKIAGLFAIFLMLVCFGISLVVQMYLRATLLNYIVVCALANVFILSVEFMFFYVMPRYMFAVERYISVVLPMALISVIVGVIYYFFVRSVNYKIRLRIEE